MTRKRTHNKHIKKFRKSFSKEKLKGLYQKARQRAKTELKNKHIKEYHRLIFKHLKKLKSESNIFIRAETDFISAK